MRRLVSEPGCSLGGMSTRSFTIVPQGEFSLRESAVFGFGQRVPFGQRVEGESGAEFGGVKDFDGVMRLAFCLDGYQSQVGIEVRQDQAGVHCEVHGDGDLGAIQAQVARVLSLDYDGRGFAEVGKRDPVIGRLQRAAPGLRPPLFYSPYEAAAWAVLSARRPAEQMALVRRDLSEAHGASFTLAGQSVPALPTPQQMLAIDEFPGLPSEKLHRLHGVAQAALEGQLDVARLRSLGPEEAMSDVQRIKGIGPFYSGLIVIRGTGFADVLPNEPMALDLVRELYGLAVAPSPEEFETIAEPWRPFRTWAVVLIRAAAKRLQPA